MPLNRKSFLSLNPIRTTLGLDKSDKNKQSGIHSPVFSPPSPTIERQVISPQVEVELRNTLIKVLRDINQPSSRPLQDDMFWKRSKASATSRSGVDKTKGAEKSKHKKNPSFTIPETQEESPEVTKKYDSGVGVELARVESKSDNNKLDTKTGLTIRPVASVDSSAINTAVTADGNPSAHSTALTSAAISPAATRKGNPFDALPVSNPAALNSVKSGSLVVNPVPPSSVQRPSSAAGFSRPTEAPSSSQDTSSKRRSTIGAANKSDRFTVPLSEQSNGVQSAPALEVKRSWFRRMSLTAKKSTTSLRKNKSAGDTPVDRGDIRSPTPRVAAAPALPRLDSLRQREKEAEKEHQEQLAAKRQQLPQLSLQVTDLTDASNIPLPMSASSGLQSPNSVFPPPRSSSRSPAPQSSSPEPTEERPRPDSAIIIDEQGNERALSPTEERKRASGLQNAVKAKFETGSIHSRASTPLLSAESKKSMEFPRPGSKQSTRSAAASASGSAAESTSPVVQKVDTILSPGLESLVTPLSIPTDEKPPKVDSKLSSPVEGVRSFASKSSLLLMPKLDTTPSTTNIDVPETKIELATPVTPAIEELEDPYSPNKLEVTQSADSGRKSQPEKKASGFLKRFGSLRNSNSVKGNPSKREKFTPVLKAPPSARELEIQRNARMNAYTRALKDQFGDDASEGTERNSRASRMPKDMKRSESPTPSDLFAM